MKYVPPSNMDRYEALGLAYRRGFLDGLQGEEHHGVDWFNAGMDQAARAYRDGYIAGNENAPAHIRVNRISA